MSLVCIDSQILIWGLTKNPTPQFENKVALTRVLLENLTKAKKQLAISSITLGETCAGLANKEQDAFIKDIYKNFIILPYDALAAHKFSEIYKTKVSNHKQWKHDRYTRVNYTVDMKILATAVSKDIPIIYTDNRRDFDRVGSGFIEVLGLPEKINKEMSFFE